MIGAQDHLDDRLESLGCDRLRKWIEFSDRIADGLHRPRTTDCLHPADLAVGVLDRLKFAARGNTRAGKALRRQLAAGKETLAETDTAELRALEL